MNCRKMGSVKLSYNWVVLFLILLPFCREANVDKQLIELQFVDTKLDTLFDGGTGKLFRYENSDTTLIIGGTSYTGRLGYTLLQTFTTDTIAEIKSGNRLITFLSFINGKPWMFFDTDNDNEIIDEKPYEVDKAKNIRLDNRTYFDGKKFTSRRYYIDPIHSTFAFDGKEDMYINNLAVLKTVIRMAEYSIDGRKYTFCLPRALSRDMDYKDPYFFILTDTLFKERITPAREISYRVKDTVYLGKKLFVVSSIDSNGQSAILSFVGKSAKDSGVTSGFFLPQSKGLDISGKIEITLGGNSENYTLIDFWGTWCAPCRKIIPELKELHKDYEGKKLSMVSIAFDYSERDVKEFLAGQQIDWVNIYDPAENSIISKKYKIDAFPTLILLDKSGVVLYRGIGEMGFYKVRNILKGLEL